MYVAEKVTRYARITVAVVGIVAIAVLGLSLVGGSFGGSATQSQKTAFEFNEGPVHTAEVVVGPFDIHRRYRSMEGPFVDHRITAGDLISQKLVVAPENSVKYVEHGASAPAMNQLAKTGTAAGDAACATKRELYWLKGIKLEVLDENGVVIPTAEFLCHWNLDTQPAFRDRAFPDGERCANERLATISQGITEITFPEGYAVPVASDEPWKIIFQAANRTTDKHRRIKHRATFYFIKDSELVYPMTALNWRVPFMTVVVDKNKEAVARDEKATHPFCGSTMRGVNAPNNVIGGVYTDKDGRRITGHWVVPPGKHTYNGLVSDMDPAFGEKRRKIHAAWVHIHPLCTKFSLVHCNNPDRQVIFTSNIKTDTQHGLRLQHIDFIKSRDGIELPPGRSYELEAVYNNSTGVPQDSMASTGIYFADEEWARPKWAMPDNQMASCGVAGPRPSRSSENLAAEKLVYPLADAKKDGPWLKTPKQVEINTTSGAIHVEIDPKLAPANATRMYRLLTSGAFTGTAFVRYEPNFVLQVAAADNKVNGKSLSPDQEALMRSLPLETTAQADGSLRHQKWCLSMARETDKPNSAVSSFSLILGDARHLDGGYSIFGHVIPDAVTERTVQRIIRDFKDKQTWITAAHDMKSTH